MAILRALRGGQYDCGCVFGVYELYDGTVEALIDAVADRCRAGHRVGASVVPLPEVVPIGPRGAAVRATGPVPAPPAP